MTDFANGYDHKMLGSSETCYFQDAVRSVRLVPSLTREKDVFTFETPPPINDWKCWTDTDVKEVMVGLHLHEEDSYTKFAFHKECNIPILDITQCADGSYGVWLYPPFSRMHPIRWWKMMSVQTGTDENFFVYKDCDFKRALEKAVRDYLGTYGEAFIQRQREYLRNDFALDVRKKPLKTEGTSIKDKVESRTTPPDSQAHYPSGLGYRSVLLQEMIQADRDGDENLALIRLAELEAYYHAEKYESPWWKFLYLISFPS